MSECENKCGWCAYCQNLRLGDEVIRKGENGNHYTYEIEDIDEDGQCISIINENAYPPWVHIMADDCQKVKSEQP